MDGTIKKKTDRGYGFIARPGEDKDLFFHSNDLVGIAFDDLQEGTAVTFEIEEGEKGPSAKSVKVAGAGASEEAAEAPEAEAEEAPKEEATE